MIPITETRLRLNSLSAPGDSEGPMTDDELVECTARRWLHRHGPTAIERLRERAEIAGGIGDILSAEAWQDIADAAQRLAYPRSTAK